MSHSEAGQVPDGIAFGFAAYLMALRAPARRADDRGEPVRAVWRNEVDAWKVARRACALADVWGVDLTTAPGFAEAVGGHLDSIMKQGARAALEHHLSAHQNA
jgi:mannitol-1-phosphate/altronate dehydrogenase